MPTLTDYHEFAGRHWETGTVRNFLAYRGHTAPHTGQPYTEALLMGVSGGAVMGYFPFIYEGVDPMCRILTRNTFDPLNTLLARLGIVQTILQTSLPARGVANLVDTLDSGLPAIAWADAYSLPYNAPRPADAMWAMYPLLVYGYDETRDIVHLADRAAVPLTITTAQLHTARARIKKDKFRLLTLGAPNPDKLASAVQAGIWDCIKLYTETPPKGSCNNFGLQAYRFWAEQLTRPKARLSWERIFPAGRPMFAALVTAFEDTNVSSRAPRADRDAHAEFLDEASIILNRPPLREAARHFRRAGEAWDALSLALLPDEIPPFRETRENMLRRAQLFIEQGNDSLDERIALKDRFAALFKEMETNFPLDPPGAASFREILAQQVMRLHDVESEAVAALRDAMG